MPVERFHQALSSELDALRERGTLKGAESVIVRVAARRGRARHRATSSRERGTSPSSR